MIKGIFCRRVFTQWRSVFPFCSSQKPLHFFLVYILKRRAFTNLPVPVNLRGFHRKFPYLFITNLLVRPSDPLECPAAGENRLCTAFRYLDNDNAFAFGFFNFDRGKHGRVGVLLYLVRKIFQCSSPDIRAKTFPSSSMPITIFPPDVLEKAETLSTMSLCWESEGLNSTDSDSAFIGKGICLRVLNISSFSRRETGFWPREQGFQEKSK